MTTTTFKIEAKILAYAPWGGNKRRLAPTIVRHVARNESAKLTLKPSKRLETLASFDGDGWKNHAMTQQELILLLRATIAKSGPSAGPDRRRTRTR